ncbi:MAG: Cobalt transporter [Frankiales bacterium]|nr:Cobalt transporter [Frankiales bacterium]
MIERKLIVRGVLAGAFAGLLAFVFARVLAEPWIQRAIDYETARNAAQAVLDRASGTLADSSGPDLFSRTVQANVGLGIGMVAFGAALGGIFAVTYAICLGRVGDLRPRSLALVLGLVGFLAVYFVPFLKYPANPPAIGHEETIQERGGLYLTLTLISVLLAIAAVWFGQQLKGRLGSWNATLVAGLSFAVAIGVTLLVLPDVGELAANKAVYGHQSTETPLPLRNAQGTIVFPGFPADVLAAFRLYSVLAQALLWGALSVLFAPLAEKVLQPATR